MHILINAWIMINGPKLVQDQEIFVESPEEYHHAVSEHRQTVRAGKPGGTGTNDGHLLARVLTTFKQ